MSATTHNKVKNTYKMIEQGCVKTYKCIETGTVKAYKTIENYNRENDV